MDDFQYVLEMIYAVKSVYDHGRYEQLLKTTGDIPYEPDFFWEIVMDSTLFVFADTRRYYNGDSEVEALVMYDPVMYRYNSLCRKYEAENGITETENPYVKRMEAAIYDAMRFDSYSYGYIWETKTDREKGCKIVLLTGMEFDCWYDVPEALFSIYAFYTSGIKELEGLLRKYDSSLIEFPKPDKAKRKEAA